MGNLLVGSKSEEQIYTPFIPEIENTINLEEQIRDLIEHNRLLEEDIKILKQELDIRTSRIDTIIQMKYDELLNAITYYNQENNDKINLITKDMENLLNNDKILLDKLNTENIMDTIKEN